FPGSLEFGSTRATVSTSSLEVLNMSARKRVGIAEQQPFATNEVLGTFKISSEAIAGRAYALYLSRGAADGHDVEDWLQAERELSAEALDRPALTDAEPAA